MTNRRDLATDFATLLGGGALPAAISSSAAARGPIQPFDVWLRQLYGADIHRRAPAGLSPEGDIVVRSVSPAAPVGDGYVAATVDLIVAGQPRRVTLIGRLDLARGLWRIADIRYGADAPDETLTRRLKQMATGRRR